jgi:parallel beta-helix repeat protein
MVPTPSGQGYWLVAADGGIFSFGNAPFYGSAANIPGEHVAGVLRGPGAGYSVLDIMGSVLTFGPNGATGMPPPSGCPGGAVAVPVGSQLGPMVSSAPPGTAFCLAGGVHVGDVVTPKDGDGFYGASGAVMDGAGTGQPAFTGNAANVVVSGLEIRNYQVPAQEGAVNGQVTTMYQAPSSGWQVVGNYVHDNGGTGIRIGNGMLVRGNIVIRNGQLGVGGVGNNVTVDRNEIAFNNTQNYNQGWEAGGAKFMMSQNLVVTGNYVHDNIGHALWIDIDTYNTLFDGNRVDHNVASGIFLEISHVAVVRNNTVTNNGSPSAGWLWDAGIQVAATDNVQVYNNTLSGNANGISGLQQNRGSGIYGQHLVANLDVHDNTLTASGRSGLVEDNGDTATFTRNNRFDRNTYSGYGSGATAFADWNGYVTYGAWTGYGQDVHGSFS